MTTLLLHGLGGDRSQPLALLRPILPPTERVVAFDATAHGDDTRTGEPADFTLDALADDITARLERDTRERGLGLHGGITVIGISMGAAIGLRMLLRGRIPISRAVFIRPAFTGEALPDNLAVFPLIAELLRRHGVAGGEEAFLRTGAHARVEAVSPVAAAALRTQFRAPLAAPRARRLAEIPRNAAYDADERVRLSTTDARTLVIAAERDPVHPLAVAEEWVSLLPGAAFARVPARDDGLTAQQQATRGHVSDWLTATRG